jgi:hypothetical protein
MSKGEAWAGYQLKLELPEETQRAVPESTAQKLVEALQEVLLLAGMAIAQRGFQEAEDED